MPILSLQGGPPAPEWSDRGLKLESQIEAARSLAGAGEFDRALNTYSNLLIEFNLPAELKAWIFLERGHVYFQSDQMDEAREQCLQATALQSSLGPAYAMLGDISRRRGEYIPAGEWYSRALEKQSPGPPAWYLARASVYMEQGRLADAAKDLMELPDSVRESVDGLLLQARLAVAEKKNADAAEILERGLELFPDHEGLLFLYAQYLYVWKNLEQGEAVAGQVLLRNPGHLMARRIRGLCLLELDRNQDALEDFSILIAQDSSRSEFYGNRSLALFRLGRYEDALADCNAALKLQEALPVLHYRRGYIFYKMKQYGPALAAYNRAIELDAGDARFRLARGVLQNQNGYGPAAAEDFDRALELKPDWPLAYCLRGKLFLDQNMLIRAQEDCSRALDILPESAYAWFLQGQILEQMTDHEGALNCYERALKYENHPGARFGRGRVMEKTGDLAGAEDIYLKLLETATFGLSARQRLAHLRLASESWEDAYSMASEVLSLDPSCSEMYRVRAEAGVKLRKFRDALSDLEWLLDTEAASTDLWRLKGDVCTRLDGKEEALEAYLKSLELFPGNYQAWAGKAQVEKSSGQPVQALESFGQMIRLQPARHEGYLGKASILQSRMELKRASSGVEAGVGGVARVTDLGRIQHIEEILYLYKEAEEKSGETFDVYLARAEFLKNVGRKDAAREDLHRCEKMYPNHPRVLELLSETGW